MKAEASVDWLGYTVFGYGSRWEDAARDTLRLDPGLFEERQGGMNGYDRSVGWRGIVISYNTREANEARESAGESAMGVNVNMSGKGCRAYEEAGRDLMGLCGRLLEIRGRNEGLLNVTRLDIAADDRRGSLDLKTMREYMRERKVNTRLAKVNEHTSYSLRKPAEADALGFYLGSAKSEFRFRFYDKAKEQGDYESHWVRVEMTNRRGYALGAMRKLVEAGRDVGRCVAAMIRASLLFVELDRTRIKNCSVAKWWDEFLETLEEIRWLERRDGDMTPARLSAWMLRQLAKSLSTAAQCFGVEYIGMLLEVGAERMKPKDWDMVFRHRMKEYAIEMRHRHYATA